MSWLLSERLELPESTSIGINDGQGGRGPVSEMHSCFHPLFCKHVFKHAVVSRKAFMYGHSAHGPRYSRKYLGHKESFSNFSSLNISYCKAEIRPPQRTEAKGVIWAHVPEKPTGRSTWIGCQVRGRGGLGTQTRSPGNFSPPSLGAFSSILFPFSGGVSSWGHEMATATRILCSSMHMLWERGNIFFSELPGGLPPSLVHHSGRAEEVEC